MESSEETLSGPMPLLPEGLFSDLEPGARQACPPVLQLMQHQPAFLQEKQLWLLFIPSAMQLRSSGPIRQSGGLGRDC